MTELWATPLYGKKDPSPRALVKETPKMIVAVHKEDSSWETRWTKLEHPSAIAYRPNTRRHKQYLFKTSKACLLYMAQDAREESSKLMKKAFDLSLRALELEDLAGEEEK